MLNTTRRRRRVLSGLIPDRRQSDGSRSWVGRGWGSVWALWVRAVLGGSLSSLCRLTLPLFLSLALILLLLLTGLPLFAYLFEFYTEKSCQYAVFFLLGKQILIVTRHCQEQQARATRLALEACERVGAAPNRIVRKERRSRVCTYLQEYAWGRVTASSHGH